MMIGYQMTLIGMILYSSFLRSSRNKVIRWVHLSVAIFALVFVIGFGSRGSLLTILVYVFCLLFKDINIKSLKMRHLLIISSGVLVLLFRTQLFIAAGVLLEKFGINSRTIAWLLQIDSSLDSSGRDLIYADAIEAIWENPITGYGLFGDRMLTGSYIHNFFLEILIDYGIFLGGMICTFLISRLVKVIRWIKHFQVGGACVIYVMAQLMVSNSFLRLGIFWVALGYLFSLKGVRSEHVSISKDSKELI